jgi:hypothetical protein
MAPKRIRAAIKRLQILTDIGHHVPREPAFAKAVIEVDGVAHGQRSRYNGSVSR